MIALSACRDCAWYALPRTWIYRRAAERLIVRVFPAREDDPYTEAYAEECSFQMEARFRQKEAAFIDARLKIDPKLELTLGPSFQSYEDRVKALRAEFQQTPQAVELRRDIETRETGLLGRVHQAIKRAKVGIAPAPSPEPVRGLAPDFRRARDR